MSLHPTMDRFYLSMLDYAGLEYKEAIIQPKSEKINPITVNGKSLTLPYMSNLKDPGERAVLHLLNENYIKPETSVFDVYKRALTLELNLKLSHLIITLINIGSDPSIQAKAKSGKLVDLIGSLGDLDVSIIEGFTSLFKASKKENNEGFLFDLYLKKNGSVGDTPYAAIGKVNFHSYTAMQKALTDRALDYKVYGAKLRKKDLTALTHLFTVIFPDIESGSSLIEGTDNKIFRYLNILLKTSYIVASRINEIADLLMELKEPSLNVESLVSDLSWSVELEDLYGMADLIRVIPNQTDVRDEVSNKLRVNESKAKVVPTEQTPPPQPQVQQIPQFQPPPVQETTTPASIPQSPSTPVAPPTVEDIIRGNISQPQPQMNMYQQQPMVGQPMYGQPQPHLPMWAQQEMMKQQMPQQQQWQQPHQHPQQQQWQQPHQYPQQQQQWQQPHQYPQQQFQQPQMQQQPFQQPNMYPQQMPVVAPWETQPQPTGLQVNPVMMQRY